MTSVGPYVIRNFVLSIADTNIFCIMDSDDYQFPHKLESQINKLAGNIGITSSWIRFKGNGTVQPRIDGFVAGLATNSLCTLPL